MKLLERNFPLNVLFVMAACTPSSSAGDPSAGDVHFASMRQTAETEERVEFDDGTWELQERASELDVEDDGRFVWTYLGQTRFGGDVDARPYTFVQEASRPPLPLASSLLGMRRYVDGEVWELTDVHEEMLVEESVANRERVIAEFEDEEPELAGVEQTWEPQSWTSKDCGGSHNEHVWNGESRSRKTGSFSLRQQTAVQLQFDIGAQQITCSGALLLKRWVITSAHCLWDSDGTQHNLWTQLHVINVFGQSADVFAAYRPAGYNANPPLDADFEDDWAIVELVAGHPSYVTGNNMDLYDGADSTFEDIGANVHMLGFPNDTLNSSGTTCIAGSNDLWHLSNAEVTGTPPNRIKLKSDGGPGQSGAPYYFCPERPNEVCGGGEKAEIVGLHAGWHPTAFRFVGPKSDNFRDEALNFIN